MRGAKGFSSIHGPEAKVHLGAPAGIADLRNDWEMRVGVNKYSVTHTQQKPLFSHTESSEPQPWSHLHWHSGNRPQLKPPSGARS